jgi:hypothetical protein
MGIALLLECAAQLLAPSISGQLLRLPFTAAAAVVTHPSDPPCRHAAITLASEHDHAL